MKLLEFLQAGRRSRTALYIVALVWLVNKVFGLDVEPGELEPLANQLIEAWPQILAWLGALFAILKGERIEAKLSA